MNKLGSLGKFDRPSQLRLKGSLSCCRYGGAAACNPCDYYTPAPSKRVWAVAAACVAGPVEAAEMQSVLTSSCCGLAADLGRPLCGHRSIGGVERPREGRA